MTFLKWPLMFELKDTSLDISLFTTLSTVTSAGQQKAVLYSVQVHLWMLPVEPSFCY